MDKKRSRQHQLQKILQARHYPVKVEELSEQLEVSDKTIYRDINELRDLYNQPIELLNGKVSCRQGARLELPGLWFNDLELQALLAAHQLLQQIQPDVIAEQLAPLKQLILQLLSKQGHTTVDALQRIRILGMGQRASQPQHFRQLVSATLDRQQCQLHYLNRQSNQVSERIISPQRLVHYRHNWYLDAWCHSRQDLRTFSLDNIQQLILLPDTAIDIDEAGLQQQLESSYGIFSGIADKMAHLEFSPPHAHYVAKEQWHPRQQGAWQGENYILDIPYHNPTELIMDILKYGAAVKVLAPPELQCAVHKEIRQMAQKYSEQL